jgi:hypothetical protein
MGVLTIYDVFLRLGLGGSSGRIGFETLGGRGFETSGRFGLAGNRGFGLPKAGRGG